MNLDSSTRVTRSVFLLVFVSRGGFLCNKTLSSFSYHCLITLESRKRKREKRVRAMYSCCFNLSKLYL
ncbi:hypothetical protein MtrunA17_Chr7g0224441 [Medicago truncatula]|uniref:Uncharacterized protein n=1 Tax=Medicago truncatula TaxID=3880 RepID=A0A396GZK0_MEDTR|nr:hypothetical protein MtrunA17_Chr7g0224441 [Medicago truncatula]